VVKTRLQTLEFKNRYSGLVDCTTWVICIFFVFLQVLIVLI